METRLIQSICKKVYERFPEMKGSQPGVQSNPEGNVLLIFKGKGTTLDGKTIQRTVRVVASKDGKIMKLTTSR